MQQVYDVQAVRSAAILTTSYVAGTVVNFEPGAQNQVIVQVDFTKGSATSMELKVEFSTDGTNYYQSTNESRSGGTTTCVVEERTWTATGAYRFPLPCNEQYVKISVKGTGTMTSSSCTVKCITTRN